MRIDPKTTLRSSINPFTIMNTKYFKIKRQIAGFATMVMMILVTSCRYDEVLPEVVELPDDPVSYALDIQPIFDAKCISCHGGGISPNLSFDVSYNELITNDLINTEDPENSLLYLKITNEGDLHIDANNNERALLLKWIEEGAENN